MVGFKSDNTTGSAWVSSSRGFSLPPRTENLESPFLAGDYAKADKRRQKNMKRAAREQARKKPRSHTVAPTPKPAAPVSRPAPRLSTTPAPAVPRGMTASSTFTVGRLAGVTISPETSFLARANRNLQNFANDRLSTLSKNTIPDSSGYSLDGVELTKSEYDAWMGGVPEANRNVTVEGATRPMVQDSLLPGYESVALPEPAPAPKSARNHASSATTKSHAATKSSTNSRPTAKSEAGWRGTAGFLIFAGIVAAIINGGGLSEILGSLGDLINDFLNGF
ncbi:hypothetical protein [Trueperella pecoris]|uniref:Uncharacterized protein n=1 Tax=Trueperella pecoris TaxID=2733571 RepID=A0A7M1QUZ4_9ACTO|nr:hypothetical protein [Trueperella pecoris]QOR45643.1 hypothetical protein INS88_10435 [Trueperella pecoris]